MHPSTEPAPAHGRSAGRGTSPEAAQVAHRRRAREAWVVVLVALLLRLVVLAVLDTPGRAARETAWELGHEPLCIAHAWLEGRGYADPWGHGTGLTGWLTPPYPAFLAALAWALGTQSVLFAGAVFVLQALASALTCAVLLVCGRSMGAPAAGRLAAWVWAVHPNAVWNAVNQVWDSTFVALAVGVFVWRVVAAEPGGPPTRTRRLGFGFGALLLLNPSALTLAPGALLHLLAGFGGARARLVAAAHFLLPAAVVVAPWAARNQFVIGSPGLRTNLGVELNVGNNDQAFGRPVMALHPSDEASELERYRGLGEAGYAADARRRATAWMRDHPGAFAALALRRAQLWWFGVDPTHDRRREGERTAAEDPRAWLKWAVHLSVGALACVGILVLARRGTAAWVLLGALILFPAPYYLTHVQERYRLQVEPLLVLAAAAGVVAICARSGRRDRAAHAGPPVG